MLEPGSYRFRYYLGDGEWENDWSADDYVDNDHGGADSVVHVPRGTGRTAAGEEGRQEEGSDEEAGGGEDGEDEDEEGGATSLTISVAAASLSVVATSTTRAAMARMRGSRVLELAREEADVVVAADERSVWLLLRLRRQELRRRGQPHDDVVGEGVEAAVVVDRPTPPAR